MVRIAMILPEASGGPFQLNFSRILYFHECQQDADNSDQRLEADIKLLVRLKEKLF